MKCKGWFPTNALPGSPAKVEILRLRASLGLPLFHPDDDTSQMAGAVGVAARGIRGRVPGVSLHRRKWRAVVWDGRKRRNRYLGLYATEQEAIAAVKRAKRAMVKGKAAVG